MSVTVFDELQAMCQRVMDASPLITRCTWDATQVKPPSGEVHAYMQAPDLEWESWDEWNGTYTLVLTAGTWLTQGQAVPLLLQAITDLQNARVNLQNGSSASWKLADSTDLIAAYEMTITPDAQVERMIQDGNQD